MAIDDSEIVNISTKKGNAVIISAENYNAIQETLYLLNIKGMRESIIEGKETPISDCVGENEVEF
jgi:antitoxin YefM